MMPSFKILPSVARLLCVFLLTTQCALAQLGGPSTGIYPQSGIYWDARRPGEGMYVEVQGTTVAFGIFTYLEDGSPVFYTGAGPIQSLPGEEQRLAGYYPAHVVFSDLFASRNGPVFAFLGGSGFREVQTEPVGSVRLEFSDEGSVALLVSLTGELPPGGFSSFLRIFTQFPFGINTFGSNGLAPARFCKPDLRGEWIFVDMTAPERVPWRFNFSELEVTPGEDGITCPEINSEGLIVMSFRDPVRGAELRCVETRRDPPRPDPLDGRLKAACELRLEGSDEVVFWASRGDVGLKEITATLGEYPGTTHARGTARVEGFRIR
jgi:hypothetical protein